MKERRGAQARASPLFGSKTNGYAVNRVVRNAETGDRNLCGLICRRTFTGGRPRSRLSGLQTQGSRTHLTESLHNHRSSAFAPTSPPTRR